MCCSDHDVGSGETKGVDLCSMIKVKREPNDAPDAVYDHLSLSLDPLVDFLGEVEED